VGRNTAEVVRPKYVGDSREEMVRCLYEEGSWQGETIHHRRDGAELRIFANVTALRDADGQISGAVAVNRNITKQRSLEEQLRHAQRMEAVGRLAGGVAHDFNNLLTVVGGYSRVLLDELAPSDERYADLLEIKKAADRAASLTRQLLAFSRQQILEPRTFDPGEVISGMAMMLQRLIGEDIRLVLEADPGRSMIHADPGQIEQVVVNLAVNARDAMPGGGRLRIALDTLVLDESFAAVHPGASPGKHVRISVSDNGCGMDPEVVDRIFEPFYTTKEKGKGTGLGLSTVYGVVRQSGGYIDVQSAPDAGTTFRLFFPQASAPVREAIPTPIFSMEPKGAATILVVEDDDAVRNITQAILKRLGYEVLVANGGEQALALAEEHGDDIGLLLTDVVMPGLSGAELAAQLTAQRPELKVLFTSGYTDDAIVHHGVLDEGVQFIGKPFTPVELARRLREVLEG
jgi:signal transduction histidine kinase